MTTQGEIEVAAATQREARWRKEKASVAEVAEVADLCRGQRWQKRWTEAFAEERAERCRLPLLNVTGWTPMDDQSQKTTPFCTLLSAFHA